MQPQSAQEQYSLGSRYFEGKGVRQDLEESARLYSLAAEQGHSLAQTRLGEMYEGGHGVPQSYSRAVDLFHLAAEQGEPAAQYDLGVMYKYGRGVTQDYGQALKWFNASDAKGFAAAAILKAEMCRLMTLQNNAGTTPLGQTPSAHAGGEDVSRKAEGDFYASIAQGAAEQGPERTPPVEVPAQTGFVGKTEVIWLLVIGIISGAVFVASLVQAYPQPVIYAIGALTCIFALPFALIVIAVVLAGIVQIFTPGGGSAIPILGWKGGVDGLSAVERTEFEGKPPMYRFAKVYLWLAVNSIVGAVMTLLAFAALYTLMQFAQTAKH